MTGIYFLKFRSIALILFRTSNPGNSGLQGLGAMEISGKGYFVASSPHDARSSSQHIGNCEHQFLVKIRRTGELEFLTVMA
jgi:hypothetical protein